MSKNERNILSQMVENQIPSDLGVDGLRDFDMKQSQRVSSNMEIAAITASQEYPDPMCMIDVKYGQRYSIRMPGNGGHYDALVYCKPICSYLHFVDNKEVAGENTYTLRRMKGSSVTEGLSTEVTAGVSVGIKGFEASASVTSGYNYSTTITNELFFDFKTVKEYDSKYGILSKFGLKIYNNDTAHYFFVPIYRKDPFTKEFKPDFYKTISQEQIINYCMSSHGYQRWYASG
ncbi:hypothetical protein ACTA71_001297 [Dictyostelium dimigraforme]